MFGQVPNIHGSVRLNEAYLNQASGAFEVIKLSDTQCGSNGSFMSDDIGFQLRANVFNSIYSGTSVQSPALQTLACIRI